jgi:hypothetical protein
MRVTCATPSVLISIDQIPDPIFCSTVTLNTTQPIAYILPLICKTKFHTNIKQQYYNIYVNVYTNNANKKSLDRTVAAIFHMQPVLNLLIHDISICRFRIFSKCLSFASFSKGWSPICFTAWWFQPEISQWYTSTHSFFGFPDKRAFLEDLN